MKKIIVLIITCILLILAFSCKKSDEDILVTSISLDRTNITLTVGETETLKPIFSPSNATDKSVKWISSDNDIASVDNYGKITALKQGQCTITVISNDGAYKAYCSIKVIDKIIPVTGLKLDKYELTMTEGDKDTLNVTIEPENAYDKSVVWKSSDESVATVDETGIVTAIKPGKAEITVMTKDGGIKSTCNVTVVKITYSFKVIPPENFTYNGGQGEFSINSFKTIYDGQNTYKEAVSWKSEFVEQESNDSYRIISQPSWVNSFIFQGEGSTEYISIPIEVSSQTAFESHDRDLALKNASPVNGVYDLSTEGGTKTRNTANCYLVNRAGKYKFPLVYGNAIKNGNINSKAFKSNLSGTDVLPNFTDYKGAEITSPFIYDSYKAKDAVLVCEDSKNLITDIELIDNGESIEFNVPISTIKQGNAIIAVRDTNNIIMWSWHIWVTDYKLGENLKPVTYRNCHYQLMPINLGNRDKGLFTYYKPRHSVIRFIQNESMTTQIVEIFQNSNTSGSYQCDQVLYQWGRKDPIMGANMGWYDTDGNYTISLSMENWNSDRILIDGIRNPSIFCTNFTSSKYMNLWSTDNKNDYLYDDSNANAAIDQKTIYDPCPIGFMVPSALPFRSFKNDKEGEYNASLKGRIMNCDNDEVIFMPFCGHRGDNGYLWTERNRGRYMTFYTHGIGSFLVFNIGDNWIDNTLSNGLIDACAGVIRPVKEQE